MSRNSMEDPSNLGGFHIVKQGNPEREYNRNTRIDHQRSVQQVANATNIVNTRYSVFNSFDAQSSSHDGFQRHGNSNNGIENEIARKNYWSDNNAVADEENQLGPIAPIGFAGKILEDVQFDDFIVGNENDMVDNTSHNVIMPQRERTSSTQEETIADNVANHMQVTKVEQGDQQKERDNDSERCSGNDVFCVFEDSDTTTADMNEKVTVTSLAIAPTVNKNSHHSSVTQGRHHPSARKNNGAVSWTTDHGACVQDDLDLMHKALSRNHCSTYGRTNMCFDPSLEEFDAHDCVVDGKPIKVPIETPSSRDSQATNIILVQMSVRKLGEMHGRSLLHCTNDVECTYRQPLQSTIVLDSSILNTIACSLLSLYSGGFHDLDAIHTIVDLVDSIVTPVAVNRHSGSNNNNTNPMTTMPMPLTNAYAMPIASMT